MLAYKEIKYKKKAKKGEWRPKYRWLTSFTISLDGSKKDKHYYYIPKSAEEEERFEKDFDEKMNHVFDIIFPEGIGKVLEDSRKHNKTSK
jgi:hypothetical protein